MLAAPSQLPWYSFFASFFIATSAISASVAAQALLSACNSV
jgi:hypothetical protein